MKSVPIFAMNLLILCLIASSHLVASIPYSYDRGSSVMSTVRRNWGPPVRYLEKRGYTNNNRHRVTDDDMDDQSKLTVPSYGTEDEASLAEDAEENADPSTNYGDYLDDPYFGEKFIQSMKAKWNNLWPNQTTTVAPRSTVAPHSTVAPTTIKPKKTKKSVILQSLLGREIGANVSENPVTGSENLALMNSTANLNSANPLVYDTDVEYLRKFINCSNGHPSNGSIRPKNGNIKKNYYISVLYKTCMRFLFLL